MKNLRDTLVFMVGRRVAIAASVCALACIRCSSFSGTDTSPAPPTDAGTVTPDGGSGPPDSNLPTPPEAGVCESTCLTTSCERADFDAMQPAQVWISSPDDSRLSYVDGELLMKSGASAQAVYLRRSVALHSKYHLEFDFELDKDALVRLVQFSTTTNVYYVDMADGAILIGETKNSSQAKFTQRPGKGHMSVLVDDSSIVATLGCDAANSQRAMFSSVADPFKVASIGLHDGVSSMVELRIDNLVFEGF